jgi:pumilio family protein 6
VLTVELNCEIGSFNNPDKGAVGHQIVHRALWEYLQEINTEDEASADKKRQEIFERFADSALFDGGLLR